MFAGLGEFLLVVYIYRGMTVHMKMLDKIDLHIKFTGENKAYIIILGFSLILRSFSLNMPTNGMDIYVFFIIAIAIIMHIRFLMNLNSVKNIGDICTVDTNLNQ